MNKMTKKLEGKILENELFCEDVKMESALGKYIVFSKKKEKSENKSSQYELYVANIHNREKRLVAEGLGFVNVEFGSTFSPESVEVKYSILRGYENLYGLSCTSWTDFQSGSFDVS